MSASREFTSLENPESKTVVVRGPGRVPPPDEEQALADRLAREMADRWQRGERPPAEEFLQRYPELYEDQQAVLRLLYEEVCLRQEAGQVDAATQLQARFPQWSAELELLLDCQQLVVPDQGMPILPAPGETVGDYRLLAELGRGGQGKVFLATQPALADRPVVIKLSPCVGHEHLTLARLQHTHIVPLYAAQEAPDRNLRILCMPYLGGASLSHLLQGLPSQPSARKGKDLLDSLDRQEAGQIPRVPSRGKVRSWLASASYEQVICWLGACLADALQYAHERGLVHLDLTAANVLVTAEGLPMLLDFHLSREPVSAGAPPVPWLGGTPGYMAPEHVRAFRALMQGQPLPCGVDQRADLYSLGMVLYQALGGPVLHELEPSHQPLPLPHYNPTVSIGLADIVTRCLATRPQDRYPSASELADDLRRQLGGLPLRGVRNRSLAERWRKWRRRRPYALALCGALLALLITAGASLDHVRRQETAARSALLRGQELLVQGQYAQAVENLERGRTLASSLLFPGDLFGAFDTGLQKARDGLEKQQRRKIFARLHMVVEQLRLVVAAESLPEQQVRSLEATCQELWEIRQHLSGPAAREADLGDDLLDLAIIWADLKTRRGDPSGLAGRHQAALQLLAEAEKWHGASAALHWEQGRHRQALGQPGKAPGAKPRAAWDHLVVGRSLLAGGLLTEARAELRKAIDLEPQHFWPHFYCGVIAFRQGQSAEAVEAFNICLALSPHSSACYHNRALAEAKLGANDEALRDYTRALELAPDLAVAAFNRGVLYAQARRYTEALNDFQYALDHGADPATVHPVVRQVQQAARAPK